MNNWQGNPELVRAGYGLTRFWRYPIWAMIGEGLRGFVDESLHPLIEQIFGMPVEQIADQTADMMHLCLPYYEQALRLVKEME